VRVERAFAFVDLCGFTAFTDQHEDGQVVLVLAELRTVLRESAARRGVRVVKWLGDGAMLSSTAIDTLAALAIEIDQRMAQILPSRAIRTGMTFGPVIMFEGDDYIGRCVNLASRLCSLAEPHEVLATIDVVSGCPAWVRSEPAGAREVRGFHDPGELFRLSLLTSADSVRDPICGLEIPKSRAYAVEDGPLFSSEACAGSWIERSNL
jgi:class 3 adenylate cyclase